MTERSDSRGPLARAVSAAIDAGKIRAEDKGTAELARRYAALIDNAAPAAKYRPHLVAMGRALRMLGTFEPLAAIEAAEHLDKIADALAVHSVTSDLGPKLLAALIALGLTPAAAAAVRGGVTGGAAPVEPRGESEFERLRRERAERTRQHGA